MRKVITGVLEQQATPGQHALGSEIALLSGSAMHHQSHDAAFLLSANIQELLESTHPFDREAVHSINEQFNENDLSVAERDLHRKIVRPLGNAILPWIAASTPREVVAFSTHNTERLAMFQQSINRDQKGLQNDTLQKVEQLVELNVFPKSSLQLFDAAMHRYGEFKAMDSFERGGRQANGYCNDSTIAVANLYTRPDDFYGPSRTMKSTVFHEYLHGTGRDRGFFFGIHTPHLYLRALEEAFVTHATSVVHAQYIPEATIDDRMPFTIDPAKRYADFEPYQEERQLLAAALNNKDDIIPIDFLSETYFSARDTTNGIRRRRELEQRIGAYFGSAQQFFTVMDTYESKATSTERRAYLNQTIDDLSGHSSSDDIIEDAEPGRGLPYMVIAKGKILDV